MESVSGDVVVTAKVLAEALPYIRRFRAGPWCSSTGDTR